jgi:hypothetical protein
MIRDTCICETPDDLGDPRLRQILVEAQVQDQPFAFGERPHQTFEKNGVFRGRETGLVDRDLEPASV